MLKSIESEDKDQMKFKFWEEMDACFPSINFPINENDKYQEISEYLVDSRIVTHIRFYDLESKAVVDRIFAANTEEEKDWDNPGDQGVLYLSADQLLVERWRYDDGMVRSIASLIDIGRNVNGEELFYRRAPLILDTNLDWRRFTFRRIGDKEPEVPSRDVPVDPRIPVVEDIYEILKELDECVWRQILKKPLKHGDLYELCRTMLLTR